MGCVRHFCSCSHLELESLIIKDYPVLIQVHVWDIALDYRVVEIRVSQIVFKILSKHPFGDKIWCYYSDYMYMYIHVGP